MKNFGKKARVFNVEEMMASIQKSVREKEAEKKQSEKQAEVEENSDHDDNEDDEDDDDLIGPPIPENFGQPEKSTDNVKTSDKDSDEDEDSDEEAVGSEKIPCSHQVIYQSCKTSGFIKYDIAFCFRILGKSKNKFLSRVNKNRNF